MLVSQNAVSKRNLFLSSLPVVPCFCWMPRQWYRPRFYQSPQGSSSCSNRHDTTPRIAYGHRGMVRGFDRAVLLGHHIQMLPPLLSPLLCRVPSSEDIYCKSRKKVKASARGLWCYQGVRELGCGWTEWARHLGITQPAVGYAASRGEALAKEHGFQLEK